MKWPIAGFVVAENCLITLNLIEAFVLVIRRNKDVEAGLQLDLLATQC